MKVSNWKKYQNIYTSMTHYITVKNSNYNAKVIEYVPAGTNQRDEHWSKKTYWIEVDNGYGNSKYIGVVTGLIQAKKLASIELEKFYNKKAA